MDQQLVVGDRVNVDMIRNHGEQPFVMTPAGWVALSVKVHTVIRGVNIAEKIKIKVSFSKKLTNLVK